MNAYQLLPQHIIDFKKYLIQEEKSKHTISKYIHDIHCFMSYIHQSSFKREDVIAYKTFLTNQYAPRSVNSMLASLHSLFRFLGWHDIKVKSLKLQPQVYYPEEKELSKDEYRRLIDTAKKQSNERLSLMIQTICATGIRVSELSFITVESLQNKKVIVSLKGKTREVLLVSSLCKKLLRYVRKHHITTGPIFITKHGKAMNRSNIWREMKKLCKEAHVNPRKVFPHNLRHLFARTFYHLDKDIAKLADLLGHSSINTTRIYIMTTQKEHQKKMEHMHLIL